MPVAPERADELTLRDYASVAWRRKWFIVAAVVLTTLVAGILSTTATPRYRASADVVVRIPPTATSVGAGGQVVGPRYIENELQTARGSALEAEVREIIGAEPTLSVSNVADSDVFTFTATSTNPENAAIAANTHATAYIERQRQTLVTEYETRAVVLAEELAAIDRGEGDPDQRAELVRDLDDLQLSIELARTGGSEVIDAAVRPGSPYEPQTSRTVVLAAVVGLLLGLGAAFLVDYLDTSIRGGDDLAAITGLPTLAAIPDTPRPRGGRDPSLVTLDAPHSPGAEGFRELRTSVKFLGLERDLAILQVTSPRPGDGKTTTAANLAVATARAGRRTILIDADLRKPQLHQVFGLPNQIGLTSVLLGEHTTAETTHLIEGEGRLAVLTSGPLPPDPAELLAGSRIEAVLRSLADAADLVIVDSPPVLPVSDPTALAGVVDGVVLVVSPTVSDRRHVGRAVQRLEQVEAPLLGTVVNRVTAADTDAYHYGYGAPPDTDTTTATTADTTAAAAAAAAVDTAAASGVSGADVAAANGGAPASGRDDSGRDDSDEPDPQVPGKPADTTIG